ncbi:3-methyl-2-oxobutanoate dehydrogenase subunit VorB [Tissierella sp. Yu-01]|uniref:3-methyl-2-oxobutanoate dehydrogenase subunit VorB n=1 Tax=Tissierella sp. Yu-01 TaxID=3035694 RepID=UPI00240DF126|nr:3-methyl-2-oxobutanoate dehydrogenase subunit VorB [Tissierella sp. Yu-01]WFA10305.1 3-methyl-2-oxobutanoate dehydrogenase subunit VorB [Tissierella sp. Yu-01]
MAKVLMKGNEAVGAAAIEAGCKFFFGYPITPQNEIPEYMSRELPKVGGMFVQAESEIAAINMVYGAAGAGARVMTSSSSPGISLKQEGISYIAGAELPCVIVNMMRGGPGLGGIQPSQTDYFQATRGGGNGDYRLLVLAPADVQELVDLVIEGFDLADEYRNPVMILGDGMIGQMMEPVEFKEREKSFLPSKAWATTGTNGNRKPNIINSLYLNAEDLEKHNTNLQAKYKKMREKEVRVESYKIEDADIVISAYGTTARIAKTAIAKLEKEGYKVGLIRPISLFPYPYEEFNKIKDDCKGVLTVEMNTGQMIDDVKLALNGRIPAYFYGRTGGMVPTPEEIVEKVKEIYGGEK